MATATRSLPQPTPIFEPIPQLQNGDHLTREEFERRYNAEPHLNKAELINGVVHMPSPVRYQCHGGQHFAFGAWLGRYWSATPGLGGADNTSLRLDKLSMPQPDDFLLILPEFGGKVRLDADGHIAGGPEFVGEVSASSVSFDLHEKMEDYRRNGVQEYVVWRVEDRAIDWFINRNNNFEALIAVEGIFRSIVLPGLWLDPQALINDNRARVAQVADQGLATPEHGAFVQHLLQNRDRLAKKNQPKEQ